MNFTEAHAHFLAALHRDPAALPPALRTDTVKDFRAWKAEVRGYDQARLDLGLVTAAQLRVHNAAVPIHGREARIVRHAQYV